MTTGTVKRIVVVGAGIVGASLAYHLARKGADVTVVEAGEIASGVTGRSFAWINTSHNGPDPIAQIRGAAIQEYRRLKTELPGLKIRWTGSLSYGAASAANPRPSTTRLSQQQILDLEPNLRHPPQSAFYDAEEGVLDAVQATHALLEGARALGATVLTQTRVLGFTSRDNRVTGIQTTMGDIESDRVVLAAGTGITQLTQLLNRSLPIEASSAIFIRYRLQPDRVNTLISSPEMEVRQGPEGILLAAEDYLDDAPENRPEAIAQRTAAAIRNELNGIKSIEPESACIGLRPIAEDGLPVIGHLPGADGVYICTMHPGVALAAIVGRLASEEIVEGKDFPALHACRPDRFFPA